MTENYSWLEKTTPRSVKQLKPWPENPRLNPEIDHSVIKDYVEDLISDSGEKESFLNLIKRIATKGFIPVAPMVVWKNETNNKFYVAEGNRRILALKLLHKPTLAPLEIRSKVKIFSKLANLENLKKISVSIAPSLEDAEWFISERNSSASTIKSWSREQQQRWVVQLYNKYGGDTNKILEVTNLSMASIKGILRILKVRDLIKTEGVKKHLTEEQFSEATSHRFKMTVLERFLNSPLFRNEVGLEYQDDDIIITSNVESFNYFYAALIKAIIDETISTRFVVNDILDILSRLPKVTFPSDESEDDDEEIPVDDSDEDEDIEEEEDDIPTPPSPPSPGPLKEDTNRSRIVLHIYHINTNENRLKGIFNELREIPTHKYPNHVAGALRIFLDLSVLDYIQKNDLVDEIINEHHKPMNQILLKDRLLFIKPKLSDNKAKNVINQILNTSNDFSLNVLNTYVHSPDSHRIDWRFLNRFWDFMFPLLTKVVQIDEY